MQLTMLNLLEESATMPDPVTDDGPDRETLSHFIACPHCPGKLIPQALGGWQCSDNSIHKARRHKGMMACRGIGGTLYWVPGMFDGKMIHVAEMAVIEPPAEPCLPLLENPGPECQFCDGEMLAVENDAAHKIWACSLENGHRFWINKKQGFWAGIGLSQRKVVDIPLWA